MFLVAEECVEGLLGADTPYRIQWQAEQSRTFLALTLARAAGSARPAERNSMRNEAAAALRLVERFIARTPDRNLSPSDRSLRVDFAAAKAALEAIPES